MRRKDSHFEPVQTVHACTVCTDGRMPQCLPRLFPHSTCGIRLRQTHGRSSLEFSAIIDQSIISRCLRWVLNKKLAQAATETGVFHTVGQSAGLEKNY